MYIIMQTERSKLPNTEYHTYHSSCNFQLKAAASLFLVSSFENGTVVYLAQARSGSADGCVGTGVASLLLLACFGRERGEHGRRLGSWIFLEVLMA